MSELLRRAIKVLSSSSARLFVPTPDYFNGLPVPYIYLSKLLPHAPFGARVFMVARMLTFSKVYQEELTAYSFESVKHYDAVLKDQEGRLSDLCACMAERQHLYTVEELEAVTKLMTDLPHCPSAWLVELVSTTAGAPAKKEVEVPEAGEVYALLKARLKEVE